MLLRGAAQARLLASRAELNPALEAAIAGLAAATALAAAAVERRLQGLEQAELEAMEAKSARGGRGFDGEVYACAQSMDHEVVPL